MLPADARTHLLLYGSTEAPEKTTPSAPAASAVRSTVPAFPGSRTLASSTTSRGAAAVSCSIGTSTNRQAASRPCGVMVWASSAITSPLTACTAEPCPAARLTSSPYRDRAAAVTNTSATAPASRASRTACGPSARNSRARCRAERRASCRAALTRGERILVTSLPVVMSPAVMVRRCARLISGGFGVRGPVVDVRGQRLPGHLDQRGEGGRVGHRELGEHPAVDVHARDLQALDEPVVGHAVGPGRGVDALDPQPPERSLAVLAVTVGVGHRVEGLLLGLAVQAGPMAPVAAGPLEDDPALLVGVDRPLHACHYFDSLKRAGSLTQQSFHLLQVRRRDRHLVLQAAGSRARLVLEVVCAVGPAAHDLAGTGQPETLAGTAVRLHLRHVAVVSVHGVPRAGPSGACLRHMLACGRACGTCLVARLRHLPMTRLRY